VVIDNSGSIDALRMRVETAWADSSRGAP